MPFSHDVAKYIRMCPFLIDHYLLQGILSRSKDTNQNPKISDATFKCMMQNDCAPWNVLRFPGTGCKAAMHTSFNKL